MLKASELRQRRLGIDPASVFVCRELLMLGSRLGFIPESQREVEGLSGWEVVKRVEPMMRRRR